MLMQNDPYEYLQCLSLDLRWAYYLIHFARGRGKIIFNRPSNRIKCFYQRGEILLPSPCISHVAKSMDSPHPLQLWERSNSSEKISFSWPHFWHLQINALRFLKSAYPGQCCGVEVLSAIGSSILNKLIVFKMCNNCFFPNPDKPEKL